MYRCLELAALGLGYTKTNPLVGCVIVKDQSIVAEGYHQMYGEAHAEVNAFNQLKDKSILKDCTIYINLEPCSFKGKTPACASLFEKYPCKTLVIGMEDPNPKVSGKGVARVLATGCKVVKGVLEKECKELNVAFIHSVLNKKPYVIAKWAESGDGFIAKKGERTSISNDLINAVTQKWRKENDAFLIGKKTLEIDNPILNLRDYEGLQPIKCIIGEQIDLDKALFLDKTPCFLFGSIINKFIPSHIKVMPFESLHHILSILYEQHIGTLVVEGGTETINHFLKEGLINEIRTIKNSLLILKAGLAAPYFNSSKFEITRKEIYRNQSITYLNRKA